MRTLITGSCGFVGTHLVKALKEQQREFYSVDCLLEQVHGKCGTIPAIHSKFQGAKEFLVERIRAMEKTDLEDVDTVYHLAAKVGVGQSMYAIKDYVDCNVSETAHLLELLKGSSVKRLIVASSMSIYGEGPMGGTPEEYPVNPPNIYALTKYDQERMCLIFGKAYGIETVALRFFNCYDDQTEVLTKDGFKFFKDVSLDDEIATLNPENHFLEYHRPIAKQVKTFSGELIRFKSKSYDVCVTPEHRMYVRPAKGKSRFYTAQELLNIKGAYAYRLKCFADGWIGQPKEFHTLPEYRDRLGRKWDSERQIPMKLWCEFMGWFISEGCHFKVKKGGSFISISQYKHVHPENYARILELCMEIGFNPYPTPDGKNILICSRQLYEEMERYNFKHSEFKYIPNELKNLPTEHLELMFQSLMRGDGDEHGGRYSTTSKRLADDFVEICLKTGRSATVQFDKNHGMGIYRVSISDRNEPQLGDNRSKKVYASMVPYRGLVYDVTVPNHIIFVRRNGRSCWSSNCVGPGQSLNNPYTGVAAIFASALMNNQAPTIFEDGNQTRDFIHVSDIVQALLRAQTLPSGVYNVGRGIPVRLIQLAEMMAEIMGKDIKPNITGQKRAGDIRHCVADISKISAHGFQPKMSLEDSVRDIVQWVATQKAECNVERATKELKENGLLK